MNFSVRHAMPGRLRLNVPELCRKRPLAEAVLRWLGVQSGVKAARINYDCASLVLEYDPAQEPVLRLLLERFRNASVEEIKVLAASARPVRVRPPRPRPRCRSRCRWRCRHCHW
jgi:Cu2+-exporting ATPase